MALTYDQISAITEKKFLPKLVDNIFDSNVLFKRSKGKEEPQDGGTKILTPLNYAQATASDWYTGSETLDISDNESITSPEHDWKQIYAAVSVTRRDELKNSGDAAKVNFVKSKMKIAEKTMKDKIGTGLFSAGTNAKSITGLPTFISTANTYGGISQSTYSWWQGNVDSTTTTLTIAAMQGIFGDCSIDMDRPSLSVTTQDIYDLYYALLQPQQRFMDAETAKGGFQSLMFNGIPVVVDSHCTTAAMYFLNEEYLHYIPHKDENFRFEPFAKPINQNVQVSKIHLMCGYVSDNNRMHGKLSAITS